MLAIILALASALGYGSSDFAAGLASRTASVIQVTLLATVASAVVVAAALPFAASPGRRARSCTSSPRTTASWPSPPC